MCMGFGALFDECADLRTVVTYDSRNDRAALLVPDAFGEGAAALAGDFDQARVVGDLVEEG